MKLGVEEIFLIILFIVAPLLGGLGTIGGGSIVGAIIFLLFSIGFGVSLIFIDTNKCKIEDKFKDPTVKQECEDDESDEDCLECSDGSEVLNKPFESIWFISCLVSCCICALISIILFAVYSMKKPISQTILSNQPPGGSLQEYQNQLGGGETLFKLFKRYLKKF